nr:hypothetical protein [Tanacetum cinerariifolium]
MWLGRNDPYIVTPKNDNPPSMRQIACDIDFAWIKCDDTSSYNMCLISHVYYTYKRVGYGNIASAPNIRRMGGGAPTLPPPYRSSSSKPSAPLKKMKIEEEIWSICVCYEMKWSLHNFLLLTASRYLQRHPPSFNSETSQSLTQPQQVDSPKKGGRKKTKSKRGKNVKDEPVAAGRWLPVEEELLATCYVAVSEDNNVGRGRVLSRRCLGILKFHPKWDAPEQVDLTGDVPGSTQEDLFGHDARPRPASKPRPAKKTKCDATASTGGSSASTQFGELMEQELRLKRKAAERAFEVQAEKDRTLMRLEELRFLLAVILLK